jgi:hypothetical protein
MSKIIDIKSKKEVKAKIKSSYIDRVQLCMEIAKLTVDNKCNCVYCVNKEILASKLSTISQWLVTDYCQKTGLELYWADWFDVTVMSANKVKDIVYPNLKK